MPPDLSLSRMAVCRKTPSTTLLGRGAPLNDAQADRVTPLVHGDLETAATNLLEWLGVTDPEVTATVVTQARELVPDA